jgi:hypothetical protein
MNVFTYLVHVIPDGLSSRKLELLVEPTVVEVDGISMVESTTRNVCNTLTQRSKTVWINIMLLVS